MYNAETIGIVFWNTWYRADAQKQVDHINRLDDGMRQLGAHAVLFCLSEVSSTDGHQEGGLLGRLSGEGFGTRYTPVSYVRDKKLHEGLAMASRDKVNFDSFTVTPLDEQRGIASRKMRQAVSMEYAGFEVVSAHLSYPRPTHRETEGLQALVRGGNQVFGGDFNTLVSKKVVSELGHKGLVELYDKAQRATVPLHRNSKWGFALDHVLTSPGIAAGARLKVGDAGPSNHRPLLVTIQ